MSATCKLYVITPGKFDAIPVASSQAAEKK